MKDASATPARVRWARLRFSIIGSLLHSPPKDGELAARIAELAATPWVHPTTQETVRFAFKTIERWLYVARASEEPFEALARKVPAHAGTHRKVSESLGTVIAQQYADHPRWSYQLHYDNLVATGRERPELGALPSYATVTRYMKHHGFLRVKRKPRKDDDAFEPREKRSFEVEHVHGLWHLDFHEGSRSVLLASGVYKKPQLLGILDDRSRLCCHLQWYLEETAEALIHGLCQALQKRGVCRALLTDNGAAMLAAETTEGLDRLSIVHYTSLPACPEQNGKQESFWGQIEGRLLPMLEGEPVLDLALLNKATQAWVEQEYQRKVHSETGEAPLERALRGPSVVRESPSSDALRCAFRTEISRTQRRSDGTVTAFGVRFELPSAYRTLLRPRLRVARWDLSSVDLVDSRSGTHLATLYPVDLAKNAEGVRRALPKASTPHEPRAPRRPPGIAPHLRALMADYAATGLPPAYLPKDDLDHNDTDNDALDEGDSEDP